MLHVREKGEVHIGLWWGNLMEKGHLENVGVNGKIILKWISRIWIAVVDWVNLGHDNGKWQALVRAVMNLRFS
jgi:hypothetical protein